MSCRPVVVSEPAVSADTTHCCLALPPLLALVLMSSSFFCQLFDKRFTKGTDGLLFEIIYNEPQSYDLDSIAVSVSVDIFWLSLTNTEY